MTVVMTNRTNNVLSFPKPPEEESGTSTITCQIGSERFALHIQVEDLPPVPAMLLMPVRRARKKAASKIAK